MSPDQEVQTAGVAGRRAAPSVCLDQVSVVVPTLNSAPWIERFIANTAGAMVGSSTIVVDDASTDGTRDRLLELEADHPHLRVIRNERHLGQLEATLAGCAAADTDWILTIDDDWELTDEAVSQMLGHATDYDIIYCHIKGHSVLGVRGLSYLARRLGPLFGVPRHVCDASSTRLFRRRFVDVQSGAPLDVQLAASAARVARCSVPLKPLADTRARHTLASRLLMAGSYLRHRGRPEGGR